MRIINLVKFIQKHGEEIISVKASLRASGVAVSFMTLNMRCGPLDITASQKGKYLKVFFLVVGDFFSSLYPVAILRNWLLV